MPEFLDENSTGYSELKNLQYLRLRVAEITRVDTAKYKIDFRYLQETGGRSAVHLTSAYWSSAAFMGVMPEVGALCVIGFYHKGADTWEPVILTYLPLGVQAARRGESQLIGLPATEEDDVRERISKTIRGRLRKLFPGQVLLQSTQGSDLVLTDDVLLSNSDGNELLLRSDDGTLVGNSIARVENVSGGYVKTGPITRNLLAVDDHILQPGSDTYDMEEGIPLMDTSTYEGAVSARLINPMTLPNGKKVNYVCALPISPLERGVPLTERRLELHELSPLSMRFTEDTEHFAGDSDARIPLIEHVQGTLVGNDITDPDIYGRVLKAQLFTSMTQATGVWALNEAQSSRGVFRDNEIHSEAVADYLRVGNYRRAITKTGNVYISVPRSSQSGSLGDGHSVHAALAGALKLTLGKENATGTSAYIRAEGAVKAVIGRGLTNDQGEKGRSIDVTAAGGVNMSINGTDSEETSLRTSMTGKEYRTVGRDYHVTTKGSYNLTIHGASNEKILGKKSTSVTGDFHQTIGGDHKNTVTGEQNELVGGPRDVTVSTPGTGTNADILLLMVGGRSATITLGNDLTTIAAGNMTDTIGSGNKLTSIGTGSYSVSVGTGAISIVTATGAISVSTAAGAMSIAASGIIQITGGVINVTGGAVNLGAAPIGGVVTSAHPCLVTGAPHIGSLTVKASL